VKKVHDGSMVLGPRDQGVTRWVHPLGDQGEWTGPGWVQPPEEAAKGSRGAENVEGSDRVLGVKNSIRQLAERTLFRRRCSKVIYIYNYKPNRRGWTLDRIGPLGWDI
jgi:hypothetical protein